MLSKHKWCDQGDQTQTAPKSRAKGSLIGRRKWLRMTFKRQQSPALIHSAVEKSPSRSVLLPLQHLLMPKKVPVIETLKPKPELLSTMIPVSYRRQGQGQEKISWPATTEAQGDFLSERFTRRYNRTTHPLWPLHISLVCAYYPYEVDKSGYLRLHRLFVAEGLLVYCWRTQHKIVCTSNISGTGISCTYADSTSIFADRISSILCAIHT